MRLFPRDRNGQSAMVDAILFMTIMLIASAVIIGSASPTKSANLEFSGLQQYTQDFTGTLLAMELNGLHYIDVAGDTINVSGSGNSIGQLLCDEALILRNGIDMDFSSFESAIHNAGRTILRPGLDCAISCDGSSIFLSGSISNASLLPPEHCASQMSVFPGIGPNIVITVYVWVM